MLRKILVFGNSGSGKSTLAKRLSETAGIAHLDLDVTAWERVLPPKRRPVEESARYIQSFLSKTQNGWVVEGCYTDLLELLLSECNQMYFLNPGLDACLSNCRERPWEPHKYESKQLQDADLPMLEAWVRDYYVRKDIFSIESHLKLFDRFSGEKYELSSNKETKEIT